MRHRSKVHHYDLAEPVFLVVVFYCRHIGIRLKGLHLLFQDLALLLRQGINLEDALGAITAVRIKKAKQTGELILLAVIILLGLGFATFPDLFYELLRQVGELLEEFVQLCFFMAFIWLFCGGWRFSPHPFRVKGWANVLLRQVHKGKSLSQALLRLRPAASRFHCAVIRAGEQSGELPEHLSCLAEYERQVIRLETQVEKHFMYPIYLLLFSSVLIGFSAWVVAPKWLDIFQRIGGDLRTDAPLSYQIFTFLSQHMVHMLVGFLAIVFIVARMRLPLFFWLHPLYWRVRRRRRIFHFFLPLSTLLKAGVSMEEALDEVALEENVKRRRWLAELRKKVDQGIPFSRALEVAGFIPEEYRVRIGWAEKAETLPEELSLVSGLCLEEVNQGYDALADYFAPLVHLCLAIMIGIFTYAMYYPLFLIPLILLRGG